MIPASGYAKAKKYVESHMKLTDSELNKFKKQNPGPCITISRQSGIETHLLCERLIYILGRSYSSEWAYFDKDLLRKVITDHNLPPRIQKFLNEEQRPMLNQMLNELLGIHPPVLELVHKLSRTILNLAEFGNVILIGRGSNVITSDLKNSFHIRLISPLNQRVHTLQSKKNISKEWAKKILLRDDKNRKTFLFKNFRKDIDDPSLYHLFINVSKFTVNELAEGIAKFVEHKYPQKKIMKTNSELLYSNISI